MVKWLCMDMKRKLSRVLTWLKQLPLKYVVGGGVLILGTAYFCYFGISKPVTFSYANATCVRHTLLFPSLHKINSSGFSVYSANEIKIGNFPLASSALCFEPSDIPQAGSTSVSVAPLGGWIAKKTFQITVPPPVGVNANILEKPVSISKPLKIDLSEADKTFAYNITIAEKKAPCEADGNQIKCNIQELNLDQGKSYPLRLDRFFNDKEVATVTQKDITTLSATQVKESSIKNNETVYVKPKSVTLVLDKKVTQAHAKFYRLEGDKKNQLEAAVTVTDGRVEVALKDDLPRSADYEVELESVEAEDGSGLEDPYILPFKTSGGPKVTGISVGRTSVPIGATAAISFDQPLLESQDVTKMLALGGGASFAGKKGNQILISLAGTPKCGDFTIAINNDIQSNYEIGGNSAWNFSGRTVCHTVGSIGASSKGRPISAYYFGNGGQTILFTGAIHGNEVGTKYLMDRWIQDLEANARNIPADKSVVVVPQINPDGVASGSRTNGRNIDLNRNFATSDWRKDITDVNNRPFPGGGGDAPMSEPETRAIAGLAQRLHPSLILSYHSIGGVVAANQAGGSNGLAAKYSQLSGYRNTTGQTSDTFEYSVSGTADDWYAEKLGVASILVELSSHTSPQFDRNQKAMWAMVNS